MRATQDFPAISYKLDRSPTFAAFLGRILSSLFGLIVSLKSLAPAFLSGYRWDTWNELRYNQTQRILYVWLGSACIAFLYYALPLLTRNSMPGKRLG